LHEYLYLKCIATNDVIKIANGFCSKLCPMKSLMKLMTKEPKCFASFQPKCPPGFLG